MPTAWASIVVIQVGNAYAVRELAVAVGHGHRQPTHNGAQWRGEPAGPRGLAPGHSRRRTWGEQSHVCPAGHAHRRLFVGQAHTRGVFTLARTRDWHATNGRSVRGNKPKQHLKTWSDRTALTANCRFWASGEDPKRLVFLLVFLVLPRLCNLPPRRVTPSSRHTLSRHTRTQHRTCIFGFSTLRLDAAHTALTEPHLPEHGQPNIPHRSSAPTTAQPLSSPRLSHPLVRTP